MAAKKQKKSKPAAEKKPTSHAANRKKRRRTKITRVTKETRETRSNPAANPPIGSDITHVLLPGFGAFAATKVLQRIVYSIVQKRWPKLGKHAHALAGVGAFAGVWFLAHKVKSIAKYHDGIVMGSGVAALHGVASCYLPKKYNWLLAECKPSDVAALPAPKNGNGTATSSQLIAAATPTEGDEYAFLEQQLEEMENNGAKQARSVRGPRAVQTPIANALRHANGQNDGSRVDPDLLEALDPDEDVDDLYTGAFSTN